MSGLPPGPPPPPPPQDGAPGLWQPPKPTSGSAIASLVCGLSSIFVCPVIALAGLVLGLIGIIETGRDKPRKGRGLAITGTVVSGLAIAGTVAFMGVMFAIANHAEEQQYERREQQVAQDSELILDRLSAYARANDNSLRPGGPVLADPEVPDTYVPRSPDELPREGASEPAGMVEGTLHLHHLVAPYELDGEGRYLIDWELRVTGTRTATLRARDWDNEIHVEIDILDAAKRRYVRRNP